MPDLHRRLSSDLDWHVLLGPLPAGAVPTRQPVASPEVLASPTGWAIAGWEQIALHLSAGSAGSRSCLVVLDGSGTLLSGSDNVLYRTGLNGGPPPEHSDAPCLIRQESRGGPAKMVARQVTGLRSVPLADHADDIAPHLDG